MKVVSLLPHYGDLSVEDIRPIPTPSNERLEVLIRVWVRRTWRIYARRDTMRLATEIMRRVEALMGEYANRGEAPHVHILWMFERTMQSLALNMMCLRANEEAARALKADIRRD
ncbi:hypothetical protein N7517_004719 [Penicillium concentricum]|uniref:Uncharacterized protein n=1 Tax=Penicillium concentricum TaxID=293559 RepID=A0A9W9V8E9_9EURO|nr:uncharacterized protein N7517_004719 [Penicillium concentricum]KAJ5372713.1 hypothetical protein N7517_004719 [Penicillium concentricum]